MKAIIYPYQDTIAIVVPSGMLPLEETALKDVPKDTPFIYTDHFAIPNDDTSILFRDAWTADFSKPDGYGKGQEWWFAEQTALEAEEKARQDCLGGIDDKN